MNNSNFNPNEEIEAMKTTDAAETPVDDTPAADKAVAAETAAEATASEPDVKQETVEETASEPADKADDADEAPASAANKSAHMTAAAAALNVEDEEVDIRRRQPRVQKEIKKDKPSRLHARRKMQAVLYSVKDVPTQAAGRKKNTKVVDLTDKLFTEIAPKYADRNGGYTRIIKIGLRKGDAAMEVVLELV